MAKKIAILVRDRQGEGLRMGVGMILADDAVTVFIMDKKIEETEENMMNLETMNDMDVKTYTNFKGNEKIEYLSTEDIAKKLLEFDTILPY